ncbi:FAD-dependent oxidoreductase [Sphingomonas canadensis]|uniref:FAD-dependent oxidoreductase n=1 Tax=Sphingomonas canadensis TaxID=1219257 RepID=A0ABW3HAV3_9SPHN|nr:FAD-dependent oxidoreductase [Sphingomonas canadensis]MCW3837629.1 FAD-dependent oxidoreductase [Sphingomonas canadensis]
MASGNSEEFIDEPARALPVLDKVDVLVCGGGAAGVAAAVSAARNGARVLTIERDTTLGGTGPRSFVTEYHQAFFTGGIMKEVIQRLRASGGADPDLEEGHFAVPFDPEVLKFVLWDLFEESGAELLAHTQVTDAIVEDGAIKGVVIENKSGRQVILADVVIDCTGDADIAARANAPMQEYNFPQPMVMLFQIGGVDYAKSQDRTGRAEMVKAAKADGRLAEDVYLDNFSNFGIAPSTREGEMGYIYGIRILRRDPYDADDLTDAEVRTRLGVREFMPFLRTVPGFENAFLIKAAPMIGVRDSRRVLGEYTLTREDILGGIFHPTDIFKRYHRLPDTMGFVRHPTDGSEATAEFRERLANAKMVTSVFGVPFGCLVPQEIDNLLVAGKTVSMSYEAHSRCRQIPDCMAFGQAAGTAAALACREGIAPRRVDIDVLRDLLIEQGQNLAEGAIDIAKAKVHHMVRD